MPSLHFSVSFSDLSIAKQEEMAGAVKELLLRVYKEEGEEFMRNEKWYVPPKTWYEAYCRYYAINYFMWGDLKEDSKEFRNHNWISDLDEYTDEQAREKCHLGMNNSVIEVEL